MCACVRACECVCVEERGCMEANMVEIAEVLGGRLGQWFGG